MSNRVLQSWTQTRWYWSETEAAFDWDHTKKEEREGEE